MFFKDPRTLDYRRKWSCGQKEYDVTSLYVTISLDPVVCKAYLLYIATFKLPLSIYMTSQICTGASSNRAMENLLFHGAHHVHHSPYIHVHIYLGVLAHMLFHMVFSRACPLRTEAAVFAHGCVACCAMTQAHPHRNLLMKLFLQLHISTNPKHLNLYTHRNPKLLTKPDLWRASPLRETPDTTSDLLREDFTLEQKYAASPLRAMSEIYNNMPWQKRSHL